MKSEVLPNSCELSGFNEVHSEKLDKQFDFSTLLIGHVPIPSLQKELLRFPSKSKPNILSKQAFSKLKTESNVSKPIQEKKWLLSF